MPAIPTSARLWQEAQCFKVSLSDINSKPAWAPDPSQKKKKNSHRGMHEAMHTQVRKVTFLKL
jgi:hypothetical protein